MNQLGTKLQTFARDFLLNQVYRRKKSSFVPDLIFSVYLDYFTIHFISFTGEFSHVYEGGIYTAERYIFRLIAHITT